MFLEGGTIPVRLDVGEQGAGRGVRPPGLCQQPVHVILQPLEMDHVRRRDRGVVLVQQPGGPGQFFQELVVIVPERGVVRIVQGVVEVVQDQLPEARRRIMLQGNADGACRADRFYPLLLTLSYLFVLRQTNEVDPVHQCIRQNKIAIKVGSGGHDAHQSVIGRFMERKLCPEFLVIRNFPQHRFPLLPIQLDAHHFFRSVSNLVQYPLGFDLLDRQFGPFIRRDFFDQVSADDGPVVRDIPLQISPEFAPDGALLVSWDPERLCVLEIIGQTMQEVPHPPYPLGRIERGAGYARQELFPFGFRL